MKSGGVWLIHLMVNNYTQVFKLRPCIVFVQMKKLQRGGKESFIDCVNERLRILVVEGRVMALQE